MYTITGLWGVSGRYADKVKALEAVTTFLALLPGEVSALDRRGWVWVRGIGIIRLVKES